MAQRERAGVARATTVHVNDDHHPEAYAADRLGSGEAQHQLSSSLLCARMATFKSTTTERQHLVQAAADGSHEEEAAGATPPTTAAIELMPMSGKHRQCSFDEEYYDDKDDDGERQGESSSSSSERRQPRNDDDGGATTPLQQQQQQQQQRPQTGGISANVANNDDESDPTTPTSPPPSRMPSFDDLFFDLLFAAALSVYSNNADLSSAEKIAIFIGSFALQWWSWWTQTRFDVRFRGRDKLSFVAQCAQRVVRCALLGVWVAFATVTSEFARSGYANFTLIYVASRALLILDYAIIVGEHYLHRPIAPRDEHIPGAADRRKRRRMMTPVTSHIIMASATLVSAMMWLGSRYIHQDQIILPATVIAIWIAGIVVEMSAELFVELHGPLRSLSATPIVERLALFSLIVFGNGFENVGQILNNISPGSHESDNRRGKPIGGWSSVTVVNAGAGILIVLLLFYGYFARAIKDFIAHPARIILWAYVHLVLHVSAAVLMIGLGKVIGFVNTLIAFHRFTTNPQDYLPNTTDWNAYLSNGSFDALLNSDAPIKPLEQISNYYDRTVISTLGNTAALQGAVIPDIHLNAALLNSTVPFDNITLPAVVTTALQQFATLVSNAQSPDGLSSYTDKNLYTFYFAYLCPAIFMFADCLLKVLQNSVHGGLRGLERKLVVSLAIRVTFGVILVLVQVTYLTQLDKFTSDNPVVYCLIILACILLAECLLQLLVGVLGPVREAHRKFNEKRQRWNRR